MLDTWLPTALLLTFTGLGIAWLLVRAQLAWPDNQGELVRLIEATLPQTQCAQCGYPGCRPYAEALLEGEAINRCPPGGDSTIAALAKLLGREPQPLNPECGEHQPQQLARIREAECIGCTLCIRACPVDAILGAQGQMHVVLEESCTGCDLCREPCPVDCIDLVPLPAQELGPQNPSSQYPRLAQDATCIHCGFCEPACPKHLKPQLLFRHSGEHEALLALDLDQCIECGQCDRVCPTGLPLTATFAADKQATANAVRKRQAAEKAERLFQQHQARQAAAAAQVQTRPGTKDKAALLAAAQSPSIKLPNKTPE